MRDRLYRSRDDRIVCGVAGGMAEYFDLDPSIVRLVWALLFLVGGAGIVLYIVAFLVIPEEPLDVPTAPPPSASADGGAIPVGGGVPGDPGSPVGGPPTSAWPSRADARAARRAARRAGRGPSNGGLLFGLLLIVVGGWFLLRDLLPNLDDAVVGPILLIFLGCILIVAAFRRPMAPPGA